MCSLGFNEFSDASTVILPPAKNHFTTNQSQRSCRLPHQPQEKSSATQWTPALAPTEPPSLVNDCNIAPSRKRCRDEESANQMKVVPESNIDATLAAEPIYGEGMTLIDRSSGRAISAETQTGTWYEEQEEIKRQEAADEIVSVAWANSQLSPSDALDTRKKFRRHDHTPSDENIPSMHDFSTVCSPCFSSDALGAGWQHLGQEPHVQAAARGWNRYIENRYPDLDSPQVILRNEGKDACLVSTEFGFYLFSEDLAQGRLVALSWNNCLVNLSTSPIQFAGQQVIFAAAARTPSSAGSDSATFGSGGSLADTISSNGSADPGADLHSGQMELD
ncbi:hypothetical protein MMC09_000357 [Bachmanniomyces sp. S44760]|nr:hypothetical protein [Bachmanniomyces sp. S44760]